MKPWSEDHPVRDHRNKKLIWLALIPVGVLIGAFIGGKFNSPLLALIFAFALASVAVSRMTHHSMEAQYE